MRVLLLLVSMTVSFLKAATDAPGPGEPPADRKVPAGISVDHEAILIKSAHVFNLNIVVSNTTDKEKLVEVWWKVNGKDRQWVCSTLNVPAAKGGKPGKSTQPATTSNGRARCYEVRVRVR
jgi:hypothetical protein